MKKSIIIVCAIALAFCLSGALFAQPSLSTQQNGNNVGGNTLNTGAPIWGGASILLTFGLAYAISRNSLPK